MRVMGEGGSAIGSSGAGATGVARLAAVVARKAPVVQQVKALVQAQPEVAVYSGPRSDDPHGNGSFRGPRVRIGLLSDGTYGIERWTSAGVRQTPAWS